MKNEKTGKAVAAFAASVLSKLKGRPKNYSVLVVDPLVALGMQELVSCVPGMGTALNLCSVNVLEAIAASALTQTPDKPKKGK